MDWDEEVDVVCAGAGLAGLASAISAVDMGGEVFVASRGGAVGAVRTRVAVRSRLDRLPLWLDADIADVETIEYFAALSSDLGPLARAAADVDVPVRSVLEPVTISRRAVVPPFIGARLRDWTARCLASPSGYLYTRVTDWESTTFRTHDGDTVEVAEIGAMTPDPDNVGGSVFDWLTAQAHDRDIEAQPNCSLERILFEEGVVIGAGFTTPDGPLAVRARHGVHLAADGPPADAPERPQLPAGQLRVCLVGRTASRFGRVELLTSEPLAPGGASCRPVSRALRTSLHETHAPLQALRCGKVDGNPALGQ